MKGKVSVIVPIYKVEKYIHRCVDSILEQSYKDMEIILVNDGSPDNCGEIINEYEKKDSRIVTIHKDNGGLSDARNAGMNIVSGEYILFIDSDDWIEKEYVSKLVEASMTKNADIVQSGFYYSYDDYLLFDDRINRQNKGELKILTNSELMRELVRNEYVKNFAWGKLYKTEILKGLRFKKGVLFEDVFWAHHVMQRVERYIILEEPMYHYYQRDDSIVATYSIRNLDILDGLRERHEFIESYYPHLIPDSLKIIFKTSLTHYHLMIKNKELDLKGEYKKRIERFIRCKYQILEEAVKEDKELKLQLNLFLIQPYLTIIPLVVNKILRKLKSGNRTQELVLIHSREIIKDG